eukprot:356130-Chlamydomonas_euryale.AAC.1
MHAWSLLGIRCLQRPRRRFCCTRGGVTWRCCCHCKSLEVSWARQPHLRQSPCEGVGPGRPPKSRNFYSCRGQAREPQASALCGPRMALGALIIWHRLLARREPDPGILEGGELVSGFRLQPWKEACGPGRYAGAGFGFRLKVWKEACGPGRCMGVAFGSWAGSLEGSLQA